MHFILFEMFLFCFVFVKPLKTINRYANVASLCTENWLVPTVEMESVK